MKVIVIIDVPDEANATGVEFEVNQALTWQPWEATWTVGRLTEDSEPIRLVWGADGDLGAFRSGGGEFPDSWELNERGLRTVLAGLSRRQ